MLALYYNETADETQEAVAIRDQLRGLGINVGMRNAAFMDKTQFERVEAVLALNCPQVAELYAERNTQIELAEARGDLREFAGICEVEIFTSADELFAKLSEDDSGSDGSDGSELAAMTKKDLVAYAAALEPPVVLDMAMSKDEMLDKLK